MMKLLKRFHAAHSHLTTFDVVVRAAFFGSILGAILGTALWFMASRPDFYTESTANTVEQSLTETGTFIIHKPDSGCPIYWQSLPKYFTRNGKSRDACYIKNGDGPFSLDYLDPDEGFTLLGFL